VSEVECLAERRHVRIVRAFYETLETALEKRRAAEGRRRAAKR
jgi:hypothetical protein